MFTNREHAGRLLGLRLAHFEQHCGLDVIVLGLARGGVVVAAQIAEALAAPLDVLVVRKLGAPARPELAIGAVTDGEHPQRVLNERVIATLGVQQEFLQQEIERQLQEVRRRQALYRGGRPALRPADRVVIIVDDGIATGATVRAGIQSLRRASAGRIVLAVPVAPPETARALGAEVDELACLETPDVFPAVGSFYDDFRQTTDEEVIALLRERGGTVEREKIDRD